MRAFERALRELVLGPSVLGEDPAAVDAWLQRNGVTGANAGALRAELARLSVYRELVRGRLRDAVELAVPRFRARLGVLFDEYFDRYLAERGPRSRYLRDVTSEFLDFFEPLAGADARVPCWALELARHEALDIVVGSLVDAPDPRAGFELDLDGALSFTSTARVARYTHAVHRLSADPDDRQAPEHRETALFVYRGPEHDVRYLELTPLAAAIVERLLAGDPLRSALETATRELGVPLDGPVLEGTARVLAELSERGAIRGARESARTAGNLQKQPESAENARPESAPPRTG
jgi:hypothetical protein